MPGPRGCLVWGVPGPGGGTWSQRGVSGCGGGAWSREVPGPRRVPGSGRVPGPGGVVSQHALRQTPLWTE